jgi:hypothetical protein
MHHSALYSPAAPLPLSILPPFILPASYSPALHSGPSIPLGPLFSRRQKVAPSKGTAPMKYRGAQNLLAEQVSLLV